MQDLLQVKNDEAVCTSLDVAERFGKRHDNILRDIEHLLKFEETTKMFKAGTYTDASNRKYRMYYINRDGFSLLVMGFNGKKALEWKLQYIEAFNKMEKVLSEKQTQTWLESRQHGMLTRKSETDVIKQLVEYSKAQGSTHAEMLYITYSKLANKMAGINGKRDTATTTQLNTLTFIENIILNQIRVGMQREMDYHDIYTDCKKQIELFKDIAYLEAM